MLNNHYSTSILVLTTLYKTRWKTVEICLRNTSSLYAEHFQQKQQNPAA